MSQSYGPYRCRDEAGGDKSDENLWAQSLPPRSLRQVTLFISVATSLPCKQADTGDFKATSGPEPRELAEALASSQLLQINLHGYFQSCLYLPMCVLGVRKIALDSRPHLNDTFNFISVGGTRIFLSLFLNLGIGRCHKVLAVKL